ncbi:MAG: ADP-forming succinate--CoA ligase subunit beta [Candidatus Kapabacteria bacterium]|jgi:succinyl-CoA synthetase beta subunit|nr:ADP-forming succinate--CoA ligase subunit beta [Candidatus Kapabacteria bacterium]
MKIHEYQAKELLRKYDVPTLKGRVITNAFDAGKITYDEFESQGIGTVVLKAQIHAGGRGKGTVINSVSDEPAELFGKTVRGVNVIRDGNISDKVYQYANATLGNKLITIQTGPEGSLVSKMLIEEGVSIDKEFYAGITLDRQTGRNVVMVSTEGGVEIETVAEETPEKIIKEEIDPSIGFRDYQARALAFGLNLKGQAYNSFINFITKLVTAYHELDCSLVEINPLVLTNDGQIIALDCKMTFDENALYRHPEYIDLRDISEEAPLEVEASKFNLNYIKLDGNVGCMVNGAGLAMATMDLIQLSGGKPANFLDVGGGANPDRIANAFRIMLSDSNVEAVLINIFGGIVRCDRVAEGIIQALHSVEVNLPVIVRLDGTNAKEAAKMLKQSKMKFNVAQNFEDAARLVSEVIS